MKTRVSERKDLLSTFMFSRNGNMVTDLNKSINGTTGMDVVSGGAITYNHLNLPAVITVAGKGTITYTYDAAGNKLQKTVAETGQPVKTTLYMGGAVYENDVLQFFGHEEGRMRPGTTGFNYDYMIKDHLGNIRMVLTEEQKQNYYPAATLEGSTTVGANSMVNEEKKYFNIVNSNIVAETSAPSWGTETVANTKLYYNHNNIPPGSPNPSYPGGVSPTPATGSTKLYKLNATTNRTGLEFVIKVMAGDKLDILGKSYYVNTTPVTNSNSTSLSINQIMTSLLLGPANPIGAKGATATDLTNLNSGEIPLTFIRGNNSEPATAVPKAYINYILLDDQFKYAGGGASRVGTSGVVKDHWTDGLQNINVTKSGYLFVYVSNESNFNVFFDNVEVVHTRGAILEETHYYPFGGILAGISSKAMNFGGNENKNKYNGKEQQNKEFSDGSGLDWYDYGARMYDNQIGRWMTQDPHAYYYQNVTPYNYVMNNPMSYIDPNGMDYYFDYDGNYLGSDGNGDKLRLTQKADYDAANKAAKKEAKGFKGDAKKSAIGNSVHNALTSTDKDGNSKSREITISGDEAAEAIAAGMSTVDYLYSQTNGDNKGERNVQIYLNTTTATIEFGPKVVIAPKDSDPNSNEYILTLPYAPENYVLIGNIHGHPDSKVSRYDTQDPGSPGYSPADRGFARDRNIAVYSIEKDGTGRGSTNVYVNPPGGQTHSKYEGGNDARSIKQDAIWQRIRN